MRKQTPLLLLMLSVLAIVMVMPASAQEVTITFDEGRVSPGEEVANHYSDLGVTFSSGARVVDTNPGSGVDLGFSPTNGVCTINFNPYVRSVSIDFTDSLVGVMDAVLVNGQKLSDYQFILTGNTLNIETSAENPIKTIQVHSLSNVNLIKFDNLSYTPIPEFPTVAVPVAAILGIMIIFQRRKN